MRLVKSNMKDRWDKFSNVEILFKVLEKERSIVNEDILTVRKRKII